MLSVTACSQWWPWDQLWKGLT